MLTHISYIVHEKTTEVYVSLVLIDSDTITIDSIQCPDFHYYIYIHTPFCRTQGKTATAPVG